VSSTSSFLLMYLTSHLSIYSSENSIDSVNSFSHATFNTLSWSSNFSLDESIVSINRLGPSSYFMRLTIFKYKSSLLFFKAFSPFIISLKFVILFNQHALICVIRIFKGRFFSLLGILFKIETLAENVPTTSL
jgi:hypothetical protein